MKANLFVIDTNILISSALSKNSLPQKVEEKANRTGRILASTSTYDEFCEVFTRSKFDKYLSLEIRNEILAKFKTIVLFVEVSETITACRDPKDNKFLELAVAANASCVITGDEDLLTLHPFRGIPIVKAKDFLDMARYSSK